MRSRNLWLGFTAIAILSLTVFGTPMRAAAQQEKVLYNFGSGSDGYAPNSALILDSPGNLYGTTVGGGSAQYGTVFELSPGAGGAWTETILHSFTNKGDGHYPYAPLIFDAAGNLYGTAERGGAYGFGAVFELVPTVGGGWTEKLLHNFNDNGIDGLFPFGGLVLDSAGNLYGMTAQGGSSETCQLGTTRGCGTVFELTPSTNGSWIGRILHVFTTGGTDGNTPYGSLVFDSAGNLFGATNAGGTYGYGTIFEMKPTPGVRWTETVLHSFNKDGVDGFNPDGNLIIDAAGNLYGTTQVGGNSTSCPDTNYGCGTVFELERNPGGNWHEKILHNFANNGQDGYYIYSSLVMDASGNLYGTSSTGGAINNGGTVFVLKPTAGGASWTERILHSFGLGSDGASPSASMIFGPSGVLYGTTGGGGTVGYGTVFEIKP